MSSIVVGVLSGHFLDHSKENPFPNEKRSIDYALFSKVGKEKGVRVVVGSIRNVDCKILKEAHEFIKGEWKKIGEVKIDVILDRSLTTPKLNKFKKEITKTVPILNDPDLNLICWDKYSYKKLFPEDVTQTFSVNNKEELVKVVDKIKSNKIVLKPRFGIMGNKIRIVDKNKIPDDVKHNTVVQEFIETSEGVKELGIVGIHDVRTVLINHHIDHCYIRVSSHGLTSNITQGGLVHHVDVNKIPKSLLKIIKEVSTKLKKYEPSLYTVDCAFTNEGKPVLIELESIPGMRLAYENHKKLGKKFMEDVFDLLKQKIK